VVSLVLFGLNSQFKPKSSLLSFGGYGSPTQNLKQELVALSRLHQTGVTTKAPSDPASDPWGKVM